MRLPERITPFYFGEGQEHLFGCYHEPTRVTGSDCAFVICQPIGHEYIASHRALRQLASRLSDAGFPVLRFDYYGCGDSAGEAEEAGISRWLADVSAAIVQVKHRSRSSRVCLIGLRLGAALSMITGAARDDIDGLVLWDPVLAGKRYVEELRSLQKQMLRFRPKQKGSGNSDDYIDILGFPISRDLQAGIENINLLATGTPSANHILLIKTDAAGNTERFRDYLAATDTHLEYRQLDTFQVYLPTIDGSLPVPSQLLQSIVAWARKNYS